MASYNDPASQPEQYPGNPPQLLPQYPAPSDSSSPHNATFTQQLYPNTDPALQPAVQPVTLQPAHLPQQQTPTPKGQKSNFHPESGDGKTVKERLRKACDSCSIRKVKCDENSPCKACVALDIPCTFDRPSKRRGPPNRHADAIKKQRTDSQGNSGQSRPASPTHAAHTLASFSQQQVLSAEAIMPWPVLLALVDDYFTFIHPLIPVPHEPSFRQALQRREDLHNSTFLALLASMLGCLVASFPRRPRQHLRTMGFETYFPNSMSVVERCHKVAVESQGPATFHRKYTIHDAIISYLQGLTSGYTFDRDACLLYFKQCLSICTTIGLHKTSATRGPLDGPQVPRMTPNGQGLQGPQSQGGGDLVLQELGRRTFWVLFVGIKTLHQLGVSPFVLNIPPATKADPYPPLPLEVDDQYLTPHQILRQPAGSVSQLVGFNINARVFAAYDQISTNELIYGVDEVFDWERQKAELEQSLQNVKRIVEELPIELQIKFQDSSSNASDAQYPSPDDQQNPSQYQSNGNFAHDVLNNRSSIQHEIQKANIHASQLGTRSYLVEKYWALSSSRQSSTSASSRQIQPSLASTSSSALTEAAMTAERLETIQDFLRVLTTISQVNMEPNGASFIHKVRAIASTLLDAPDKANGEKPSMNSLGHDRAEEYLQSFVNILAKLENVVPPNDIPADQDEDAQLREWADLRAEQQRFARAGGFMSTV